MSTVGIVRVVACVALIATWPPAVAQAAPEDVPTPTVTGPVSNATSRPFFSTDIDLAGLGYVEEEFFIEGNARRYLQGQVTSEAPYKTRMVVRRPQSTPARATHGSA